MASQTSDYTAFFIELLKKNDVQAIGSIFKSIYDLIQWRKYLLPTENTTTNLKEYMASLKTKTAQLHNLFLYNYGAGSLADHHLEIVKKIMKGNVEELNSIENIVHVSNRSRGIREVDEWISTIMRGKEPAFHSEYHPVKEGDVQGVQVHLDHNRVKQNNITNPQNPLELVKRGVQMTSVIVPRPLTLVEQMNGAENMLLNVLNPGQKPEIQRETINVSVL